MSAGSKIEWTDVTWNPVRGCTKVSAGCKHCYAETFAERWRGVKGHAYEQGFDLRLAPEKLTEPLSWKKPRRVFVNSMSDLFHAGVPIEFIDQVFAVMALTPQHTYQVLTKRADRMAEYSTSERIGWCRAAQQICKERGSDQYRGGFSWPLRNVWLGASVENQAAADKRIPELLKCPAAVRFLSCEPLLGSIDLGDSLDDETYGAEGGDGPCPSIDWVIVGGESGPGARPCHVEWIRSIVNQCRAANVPVFVKQLGADPRWKCDWAGRALDADVEQQIRDTLASVCKSQAEIDATMSSVESLPRMRLRHPKGGDTSEWPEDLRVRQWPALSQVS